METFRIESDLLGEKSISNNVYYGVQTLRALENFKISNQKLSDEREFIKALGIVKLGAAQANYALGLLNKELFKAIEKACLDVIEGSLDSHFPVDLFQGGAGTSTNMNANEVIANRALEYLGFEKGAYKYCSPNDHINLSQSTNDAYPSALKLALYQKNKSLTEALEKLFFAFDRKSTEFIDVIKMGRTQLQDAVPMTLGQEFRAFAKTLRKEIMQLQQSAQNFLEINMGATAIGTGLNATPGYANLCTERIAFILNEPVKLADDLVEATSDTSAFVNYSGALKQLSIKLSKICNDLRLLSSGPRTGLFEINLPAKQPGSSIMPGKVNPVIPEVVNQICFKVIGNDTTIAFASEAGQLQLNVMEPVIAQSLFESINLLTNGLHTLRVECVDGITANKEHLKKEVENSIGIVTALNPYIGYKNATKIAKEALETGKSVYQLVIEHKLLSKEKLDDILNPKNMLGSTEENLQ